jgi:hypothetical protein
MKVWSAMLMTLWSWGLDPALLSMAQNRAINSGAGDALE